MTAMPLQAELDPDERQELRRGLLVPRLIWVSFLSALVIYLIIAHLVSGELEPIFEDDFIADAIAIVLYVLSLGLLGSAYLVKRLILRPRRTGLTSIISRLYPTPVATCTAAVIFCASACVCIGIFGLIMFILEGSFLHLYLLIAISAAGLYYFRPRFSEIEQLAIGMKNRP